jgi:hypothetical protein
MKREQAVFLAVLAGAELKVVLSRYSLACLATTFGTVLNSVLTIRNAGSSGVKYFSK